MTWEQKHADDFQAIHDAMHSIVRLNFQGTTNDEWLTTVREVRERVETFSIFVPNAPQVISLLNLAETLLLAANAVTNLAKDA